MASLKLGIQFFLYSFVGAIACFVDLVFFLILDKLNIHPLIATAISFSTATLVNYFLCFKFIFARGMLHPYHQILRTFLVALVGLIFNVVGLALLMKMIAIEPLWGKTCVIPFVMVWNFWSRRTFVFSPQMPSSTLNVVEKLLKNQKLESESSKKF
jgi:putative flippase GtrA